MPHSNPLIDGPPIYVPNQAPGSSGVNPFEGTDNAVNAAGTQEALASHVAAVVAFALIGVYVLRMTGFKFVVAAGVGS